VENLYVAMGQPVVTTETFWAIYCDLLKQLCDGSDKVLSEILNSHEQSLAQQDIKMALLQDINLFRLSQPLNIARNGNYIGRLDLLALPSDVCYELLLLIHDFFSLLLVVAHFLLFLFLSNMQENMS
jgi:hypothetical protein